MIEVEKAVFIVLERTDLASSCCEPNNTNIIDELHSTIKIYKLVK